MNEVQILARKYVSLCYSHCLIDDCFPHKPDCYDAELTRKDDYPFMERVEKFLGLAKGGAGQFRGDALKMDIHQMEQIIERMLREHCVNFLESNKMEPVNYLLSPKYVEFAKKIIALNKYKQDIEKLLDKNRQDYNNLVIGLCRIENDALAAQREFDEWKKECLSNTTDS